MKKELIAYSNPKSPVSEMFKTLRTNIQFMNSDKTLKTILITSTFPGEGKSWTSANLAVTFAQAGKRVLIIDADMRKGRQFNIFDVSPTPGLSNYLSGMVDGENVDYQLGDFIQQTEVENLYIMTAGNVPPNPSELLVSEKMLDLMAKVKEIFDITIFDGTPSLIVTDAPVLSRIADSTIIVTAHNETKIDNVTKVKKAIENVGGKIAGVVINKIPISAKKYENTYYYYGSTASLDTKSKRRSRSNVIKEDNKFRREHEEYKPEPIQEPQIMKQTEHINQYKPVESTEEESVQPILSWEEQSKDLQNEPAKEETTSNTETGLDKTQDMINQINKYLDVEKNKLENGDNND